MAVEYSPTLSLAQKKSLLYAQPWIGIHEDVDRIYNSPPRPLGILSPQDTAFEPLSDSRFRSIVGKQLGDEGKGKLVDALAEVALSQPGIETLDGIRFNGGSNAGHTVEFGGQKTDLHQVPSVIFQERATAILDTGMAINVEDLRTEIGYIEERIGNTNGRILVSASAAMVTDLERAEEKLNNHLEGKTGGGTGRGMSPAYAHRLDRTGSLIENLLDDDWKNHFSKRYRRYQDIFAAFGVSLKDCPVPDFKGTRKLQSEDATVGGRFTFLQRLGEQRAWLLEHGIVQDTFEHHREASSDPTKAVIFEGAQAVGLDPWVGTYPDTGSSNSTNYGINSGTGFYKKEDVRQRIGVIKHNPSSVGVRHMPTQIDLPKHTNDLPDDATLEQQYFASVRKDAREVGTTTGRWRDMYHTDLPQLTYNTGQGGDNAFGITHMDIQKENMPVKIAPNYRRDGQIVGYQPSLRYLNSVQMIEDDYIEVPGWDGEAVANAKTIEDMPDNAVRFMTLIQERTGVPVIVFTNGSDRDSLVKLPGFDSM